MFVLFTVTIFLEHANIHRCSCGRDRVTCIAQKYAFSLLWILGLAFIAQVVEQNVKISPLYFAGSEVFEVTRELQSVKQLDNILYITGKVTWWR